MKLEGGCYCGGLRYATEGEPVLKAQCHCRACTHISGGAPNMFMLIQPEGFAYTKGTPKQFKRPDIERAVTREFCADCGTHILTRRPGLAQLVLKAGTLDDPATGYVGPKMAIYTSEKQPFHLIAEGLPAFEKVPGK